MSSGCFFSKQWKKPTRHVHTFRISLGRTRLSASSKYITFVMTTFVRNSISPPKWLSAASARLPMHTNSTTRRSVSSGLTEVSVTMPESCPTRKPKFPSGLSGNVRRFRLSVTTKNIFLTSREKQTFHLRKATSSSIRPSMFPNPKSRIRILS